MIHVQKMENMCINAPIKLPINMTGKNSENPESPKVHRTSRGESKIVGILFVTIKVFLRIERLTQEQFLDRLSEINPEVDMERSTLGKHLKNAPKTVSRVFFDAACELLKSKGHWPPGENIRVYFDQFADFFDLKAGKRHVKIAPYYEAYQWSSREPGKIIVSLITVNQIENEERFVHVVETQNTSEEYSIEHGFIDANEGFEGIGFSRKGTINFLLRQTNRQFPKFCLFHESVKAEGDPPYIPRMAGYTLKNSWYGGEGSHHTPIYLKQITEQEECQPRIECPDAIADKVIVAILNKRLQIKV